MGKVRYFAVSTGSQTCSAAGPLPAGHTKNPPERKQSADCFSFRRVPFYICDIRSAPGSSGFPTGPMGILFSYTSTLVRRMQLGVSTLMGLPFITSSFFS